MKKALIIIFIIFLCIILTLFVALKNLEAQERENSSYNLVYEQYLNKEIYGTEIATLINKAVNNNEKYEVSKDENGFYISDNENSILILIHITINDTIYPMETIYKHDTSSFVQNFNSILFKSDEVEYHKSTGKIAKIVFKQVEE